VFVKCRRRNQPLALPVRAHVNMENLRMEFENLVYRPCELEVSPAEFRSRLQNLPMISEDAEENEMAVMNEEEDDL